MPLWMQAGIPLGLVLVLACIPIFQAKIVSPMIMAIHNGSHYLGRILVRSHKPLTATTGDIGKSFIDKEKTHYHNLFILAMGYLVPMMVTPVVLFRAMDLYNTSAALICLILLAYITLLGWSGSLENSMAYYGFRILGAYIAFGALLAFIVPVVANIMSLALGFLFFLGVFNRFVTDFLENKGDFPMMAKLGSRRLLAGAGILCLAITPALVVIAFYLV